ncbi:MAG: hypothetical protein KA004_02175 [Verrucomicrobiales bacterium]|nr:hypothetical protein [Verrucomicrobiales bacterium]
MNRRFFSIAILGACFTSACLAKKDDDKVPEADLSAVSLGDIISGEKVDIKAMAGKVVVLDYWGRS